MAPGCKVVVECHSPPKIDALLAADALLNGVAEIVGMLRGLPVDKSENGLSHSPNMFDKDWESQDKRNHPMNKSDEENATEAGELGGFPQVYSYHDLDEEAPDYSLPIEEVDENASELSDSFEGFNPVFANCNNCGDTGIITKTCGFGGNFDPPARTRVQNVPFGAGPDFSMSELGRIPCAEQEIAESRRCTACGGVDMFRCKEPPHACWCTGTESIPSSEAWSGVPFEIKPPLDPAPAA